MSTLNGNYKAVVEGRLAKGEFLRQARQMVPQYISQFNSFDDAVKILTGKGLLSEELIYRNKADKFPLESIERGIRYELEVMGVFDIHYPSQEQYKKARQRAIDNLCKDPLYYINKVAEEVKQPTQEETEGDLKKVTPGKKNLQEARYTDNIAEDDLSMHKDVNMNADVGSGTEEPVKKPRAARTQYKDNHNWTVNEYKIAYILAEFGKQGLQQIFNYFDIKASNASLKLLANNIIGTTDAGLQFAIQGMKKLINRDDSTEWLHSYHNNSKSREALQTLDEKSLNDCIASLTKETCSEEEAAAARIAQEQIDLRDSDRSHAASAATQAIVKQAAAYYKNNRNNFMKQFKDPVKSDRATMIATFKKLGYDDVNDPRRAILWSFLRGNVAMNNDAARQLDAKLNVNDKNAPALKTKNLKEQEISEAPTEDTTKLNKHFLDLYIKYKDGSYQVKDKESGELKPGRKLAPETAAQKACMTVRKAYNAPRFRPDRNTIASCAVGRGKLQYQGEREGTPMFNYAWSLKEGNSPDELYKQVYKALIKAGKTPEKALKMVRSKYPDFRLGNVSKDLRERAEKFQDKQMLKETVISIIGKVLNEAATANLAQLSDENASVAELPGIINSLENIVTEIESFWIKEQQKIQGVFDQVGNIKNDDGLPVGYKFVQPMLQSLKKDLEPVLAKITLDDLKLPEAPAPDQTQVNDPNAEVDPNDPNAVPPVPEKKTVFSPAEKEPLQESKKNRRYTK